MGILILKIFKMFGTIFDKFLNLLMFIANLMLASAMLLVCLDVVMRYVFNQPIIWAKDICEFILVGIVSMGMGWLLREDKHVRMDFLVERLGKRSGQLLICFHPAWQSPLLQLFCFTGLLKLQNYGKGPMPLKQVS